MPGLGALKKPPQARDCLILPGYGILGIAKGIILIDPIPPYAEGR